MTETLIILGSARKDGDTHSYTNFVFEGTVHKISEEEKLALRADFISGL